MTKMNMKNFIQACLNKSYKNQILRYLKKKYKKYKSWLKRLTVLSTEQINGVNEATVKLRRPSQTRHRRSNVRSNSTNPSVAVPSTPTHSKTLMLLILISLKKTQTSFFSFLQRRSSKGGRERCKKKKNPERGL